VPGEKAEQKALTVAGQWRIYTAFPSILANFNCDESARKSRAEDFHEIETVSTTSTILLGFFGKVKAAGVQKLCDPRQTVESTKAEFLGAGRVVAAEARIMRRDCRRIR